MEAQNKPKFFNYWTEPEMVSNSKWVIRKFNAENIEVDKLEFKSKQDAWKELERINTNPENAK